MHTLNSTQSSSQQFKWSSLYFPPTTHIFDIFINIENDVQNIIFTDSIVNIVGKEAQIKYLTN